ncbi:MAG: hypothetical protein JSW26_14015 [Desulfobacterales bacterium]|nr:MAG: hypothetical protein JSW26_14015 [Desulfobacterales bacterium]
MIYIGHFSFDEVGSEQEIRHGYFTSVVDTDNIERATKEFKELIHSMRKMEDTFKRIVAVYLEDIIEFHHVPKKAIVTRLQSSAGEFPESITHSLVGVVSPGINVYGFEPDVRADENDENKDKYRESRAFIKFRSSRTP